MLKHHSHIRIKPNRRVVERFATRPEDGQPILLDAENPVVAAKESAKVAAVNSFGVICK
jgi:hypothetical protein